MALELVGQQSIAVDQAVEPALRFSHPQMDTDLVIRSGANSIKWSYELNTQSTPTLGGEVVQILSCFVGPITIEGMAAGLPTDGSKARSTGWAGGYTPADEAQDIVRWFLRYMHMAGGVQDPGDSDRNQAAVRFTYVARGWSFFIMPTQLSGFDFSADQAGVPWSITAEIVSDAGLDYFQAATMNTFTDSLTDHALLQTAITPGFDFSQNPFINPTLAAPGLDSLAQRLGDNFQTLVASWAGSNFMTWGFNPLGDPGDINKTDPYSVWNQLLGGEYLGQIPSGGYTDYLGSAFNSSVSSDGTDGGSAVTIGGAQAPQWVSDVLSGLGYQATQENVCFMKSWWSAEGGGTGSSKAKFNWLNVNAGPPSPPGTDFFVSSNGVHIAIFPDYKTGVETTIKFIRDTGNYNDILEALKSGNPLLNWPTTGLVKWVGPGGGNYGGNIYQATKRCVQAALDAADAQVGDQGGKRGKILEYILAAEGNKANWHYAFGGPAGRSEFGVDPSRRTPIYTDCSGYTALCYDAIGIRIPAQSDSQGQLSTARHVTENYKCGDLCIYPGHVTIVATAGSASSATVSSFGGDPPSYDDQPARRQGVNYRGDLEYVVRILAD